jgi:crotonobetainyl-CoA:carnitine CoA-transferase CaiB-like acyl-CoA transferase
MSPVNHPLAHLRVLELARILAGPWIGQTLADLGADVIKVEAPEGDDTRRWGPPFVRYADGSSADAAYFHCCNRGKRSVVADLRTTAGQTLVRSLAARADVMIENFKVGSLVRYGLDYKTLSVSNPRLVYCSVSGFGQTGPHAHRAGYDAVIQAMSGIMDLTGEPDGAPQKLPVAFADLFSGLYGVIGIQAALAQRERTGRGQQVDIALFDSMVGVLANQNLNYLVSGAVPQRLGSAHPNIVPYQVFAVRDGHFMLAVGNDVQFRRLCTVIGEPLLAEDPRYVTNQDRVLNRTTLVAALSDAFAKKTRAELLAELESQGIPAGAINTLADVFADPQILHRQMRFDANAPWLLGGSVPAVRTPIQFSDAQLCSKDASPKLGQHTSEVRSEIGMG